MDRKAAIATAFAIVLGMGAAIYAVQTNIGVASVKSNIGKLTQHDAPATTTKAQKPRTVTIYVTPHPRPAQQSQRVQFVDTTIRLPSRPRSTQTTSGTSSTSHHGDDGGQDSGGGRDD